MECIPILLFCQAHFAAKAVEVISFTIDPIGYLATQLQKTVQDLMGVALPAVLNALHPDFSAQWWIDTYRVSFALAMLTFFVLVLVSFLSAARKDDGGGKVVMQNVFGFGWLFLAGSAFGPVLMIAISKLTTSLGDSLAAWGLESSTMLWAQSMANRVASGDLLNVIGGAFMAVVLLLVVMFALLGVLLLLIVQLASIYLSGALIPLGIVWLVLPRTRSFGSKAPLVFFGILITHVLLFLMLGAGFRLLAALGMSWGDGSTSDGLVIFVNMATTGVVMVLVCLSPMGLLAIAKVVNPGGGGGMGNDGGLSAPHFSPSHTNPAGSSRTNGEAEADTSTPAPAPSASPSPPASGGGGGAISGAGAPSTAGVAANGGAVAAESGAAATAGTGVAAGAGAAAGGSAAAVGATGAAASSTGVGAAVGIPMMVGAAAIAAANKAGEMAEATANQAAEAGTHEG